MGEAIFRVTALAISLVLLRSGAAERLRLVSLRDVDPAAVCMDGTPSGYYWKEAAGQEGEGTWIVLLEGGHWCWDAESCRKRCVNDNPLCTSKQWPELWEASGIYSDSNWTQTAALRMANKVFVRYCTSDAHMGDGAAFGYQFRGARVVQAVLADLVRRRGMVPKDGKRHLLLFGGFSAGARGVMVHLDYVPSMLGAASAGVDVVGFLDSPLWLDYPPYDPGFTGLANRTKMVHGFANVSHLGQECAAAHPKSEGWRCMFGEYRLPFVKGRYFLVASQYDSFALSINMGSQLRAGVPSETWTPPQWAYAQGLAARTVQVVTALASGEHAVYSPACYKHAETARDEGFFYIGTSDGISVSNALCGFLGLAGGAAATGSAPERLWLDDCRGVDCGRGCRSAAAGLESSRLVFVGGTAQHCWGLVVNVAGCLVVWACWLAD